MFGALVIILTLPLVDLGKLRGFTFRPLIKVFFALFVANFLLLDILGGMHVESPFIVFGQISTGAFFGFFILIMPIFTIIDNTLQSLNLNSNNDTFNLKKSANLSTILDQKRYFHSINILKINNNNSPSSEPAYSDQNSDPNPFNSPHSNKDDGYETDSNRSYFEERPETMANHPARDIPEDKLRKYINDTEYKKNNKIEDEENPDSSVN